MEPLIATVVEPQRSKDDICAVTETIRIIGKKWYMIILHELTKGPKGFNQLRKTVKGISAKVLTSCLADLEQRGLVVRRVMSESPIRVAYSLAPKGAELAPLFGAMKSWGERWAICADADLATAAKPTIRDP